jgi:hypothetical protein
MKSLILLTFLSTGYLVCSQNILESLYLKEYNTSKYTEGELMSTDTILDLSNGYYEEFHSSGGDKKTILRQACLFQNEDDTKTLAVSITYWDFSCFMNTSSFYEISKDSSTAIQNIDILPSLDILDFVAGTNIVSILKKYLPELKKGYLDSNATITELLNEIYNIRYTMPREGTTITATLAICDYIPTNEIGIDAEDWAIIENDFLSLELIYDRKQKRFRKD